MRRRVRKKGVLEEEGTILIFFLWSRLRKRVEANTG